MSIVSFFLSLLYLICLVWFLCFFSFLVGYCIWRVDYLFSIFSFLYQLLYLLVFIQNSCFSLVDCCFWEIGLPLCLIAPPNITFPVLIDRSTYIIHLLLFIEYFFNEGSCQKKLDILQSGWPWGFLFCFSLCEKVNKIVFLLFAWIYHVPIISVCSTDEREDTSQ